MKKNNTKSHLNLLFVLCFILGGIIFSILGILQTILFEQDYSGKFAKYTECIETESYGRFDQNTSCIDSVEIKSSLGNRIKQRIVYGFVDKGVIDAFDEIVGAIKGYTNENLISNTIYIVICIVLFLVSLFITAILRFLIIFIPFLLFSLKKENKNLGFIERCVGMFTESQSKLFLVVFTMFLFVVLFNASSFINKNEHHSFNGYVCTEDCSGHIAGYIWAQENYIEDMLDCEQTKSNSFFEGCKSWVEKSF